MSTAAAGLFEKLTGEEPDDAEDLDVVDAETGQQLRFLFRKDLSGGGSNITVRAAACLCAACSCL